MIGDIVGHGVVGVGANDFACCVFHLVEGIAHCHAVAGNLHHGHVVAIVAKHNGACGSCFAHEALHSSCFAHPGGIDFENARIVVKNVVIKHG